VARHGILLDIVAAICAVAEIAEIADRQFVSRTTVRSQAMSIYRQLGTNISR
jgi:DNA-binding CsgD family transcriptional regulator